MLKLLHNSTNNKYQAYHAALQQCTTQNQSLPWIDRRLIFLGWSNLHDPSFCCGIFFMTPRSFLLRLTNKKPANPSCHGHFAGMTASELGTVPVLLTETALLFLLGQRTPSKRATDVSLDSDAALKRPGLLEHPQLPPSCVRDCETCSLPVLIEQVNQVLAGKSCA